ncbi:titin homolog isoform X7 [Magallana gigas]|uniref:titin homolog isoform X7 n=1 Tax=Magallana gigas TaxID=29159 RepID=UPI003342B432
MEPRPVLRKNLGLIIKNDIIRENERLSRSPSYERCGMLSPYQDKSPLHSPSYTNRDFGMSITRSQRDLLSPSYGLASVRSTSPSLSSHRDSFSLHRDSLSSHRDSLSIHRDRLSSHPDSLSSHRDSLSSNRDSWSSPRDRLSSHRDTLSSPRDILHSTWQKESRARSPGLSYRSVHKYDEEILLSTERQRRSTSVDRHVPTGSSLSYYREDRSFLDRTDLRATRSPSPFSRSSFSDRLHSPFSERGNYRDVSPLVSQERLYSPNRNRNSSSVHDTGGKSPEESVSYTKQSHQDRHSVGIQRKQIISSQENYFTPIIQDEKSHKDLTSHDTLSSGQACDVQHIPTQPCISSNNPPAVTIQDEKSNDSDFSNQSSSQTFPRNQSTNERQEKTEESLHSSISKRSVSADEKMFLSVEGGHLILQATGGAVVKSGQRTFSVMMGQPKRISEDKSTLERRLSLNENSLVGQKGASSFIEASSTDDFDNISMKGRETKSNKGVSRISDDCENMVKGPKDVNTGSKASVRDAGISKAEAVDLKTEAFKKETGKMNDREVQNKLDNVTIDKINAGAKTESQSNKKFDSVKMTEVDVEVKKNEKEGTNDKEKQYLKCSKDKASEDCEERRARSGQREGRGQSRRLVSDQEDRRDRRSRSRTPVRFLLVSNKLETSGSKDSPCCVKDHSSTDRKATTKSNESDQMTSKSQKIKTTKDVDEEIATEAQKKKVPNEESWSNEKISQVKIQRQSHNTSKETMPSIEKISKAGGEIQAKSSDIKQTETKKDAGQTHSSTDSEKVQISEKHAKIVVGRPKSIMEPENTKSMSSFQDETEFNHDTLMSRKKELAQERTVHGKTSSSDCKVITLTLKPVAQETNLGEISIVKKEDSAVNTKKNLAGDANKFMQGSKDDTKSSPISKEVSFLEDKKATGKEIPVIVIKDEVVKRNDLESPKATDSKDRTDNQSNFGFNRDRLFAKLDPRGYKIENLRRKSSSSSDSSLKSPDVFSEGKISPDAFSSGQYTSFEYSTEKELTHKKEGMRVISSSEDTKKSKKGKQILPELLPPSEPVLQKAKQDPVQSNIQIAEELDQRKPNKKVDEGPAATQNEKKQNSTDHNSMSKSIKDNSGHYKSDDTKPSVLESDTSSDRADKKKTESKTVDDRKQAIQKDQTNTTFKDLIRKTRSRLHGVSDDSESDQQNNTISKPQEMSPKPKKKQESPDIAKHLESKSNAVEKLSSQEHKSVGSERNSKNGSEDRAKSLSSSEGSDTKVSINPGGTSIKMLNDSSLKGGDTKIGSPLTKLKDTKTKMKQSEVEFEFKTQSKEVPVSQILNTKVLDKSAAKGGESKQSEKEFKQKIVKDKDGQKEILFKPQNKIRSTSETNEQSVNLTTIKTEKLENTKNSVDKNKLTESSVSTGNLGESSSNINQPRKAEVSSNSSSNITTKGSESSKDTGEDNLVSNRSDVKEVTKMTENRNELSSKSVTKLGSPKQRREKQALSDDITQMTDIKVDLKQARANLQNKKKDKISSTEITAESREGIIGKKSVTDGNSKIHETTTMAPESPLIISSVEKEQKISSPKCLPKLEKTEQVDNFEKETISPTLTKRRTDNSKQNVIDNKDTAGFKDVIGNLKASLKTKPKDTKSLVSEKESTNIYQLKKLDNSAQQKTQEKQLLEDKSEKFTTETRKYDSTDKQKEFTFKKGKETKERDMSKTLDLENDKKLSLNKLQDERKEQKLKMNIIKSEVIVSESVSTTIEKAEETDVTDKKSNEKKSDERKMDKKAQLNESVQTKSDDICLKDVISQTKGKLQKPSKSINNKTDQCQDVKQSKPGDQDPIKDKEPKGSKTKTQNFKDNESVGRDLKDSKARAQNVNDDKPVDQDLIDKDSKTRGQCLKDKKSVDKDLKDRGVQDVKDNKSIDQDFEKSNARDQCSKDTMTVGQDLKDIKDFKDNKTIVKDLKDINTKVPNFNDNTSRGQNLKDNKSVGLDLKVNQSKVKDLKDNKAGVVDSLKDSRPGRGDLTPGHNNLDHKKTGGTKDKDIKLGDIRLTGNKSGGLDTRDRELESTNQENNKLVVSDIKNTEKTTAGGQDLKKSYDKTGGRDIQVKKIGQENFKDSEKKFQGHKDYITAQDPSDKLNAKHFKEDKERVIEYKERSNSVNVKNYAVKETKALGSNSTDNASSVKDSTLTTKSRETRDLKLNENNAFDKKTQRNPNQINKYQTELEDAQKRRAPSNNLSKKLANKDPKERAQLDKSALDNVTNIMDKQTTEVSIKQEGEKSKNRHHTSKTADGKTIVPDTGNTKSISSSDVNLHSQADDKVHSTQNTGSSAKESKLVNQEKESNEMCQGTSMLGTHRKKQSNAKNEAEGIGVTDSLSNLDREEETFSYSLTKLKTAREADSNTELKKPSRVHLQNGDRQDSSSEKKHVNNANVQDPPQEIKSVNIQPRISAKNRSVNSTETTHDVSKDNKSTKVKTDVSEESGKNKDSGTARKKSKVLREFVTINDVTPVSYTEHAEVKMKDIHESRVNESIIARKPDEKVVKIETGDIKDCESKSLKMEELDLKENSNEKSLNLPKISMTSSVNSKKKSDLDSTSLQESERTLSLKESQPNGDTETSTGNKTKSNKIDLLQTKTKGRHKFVLPALKSAKAKTDVKSKNENEDVYESGNDIGVNKNGVKGKLGETRTGKTKDIIESTKIDEKKSTGGEATPKSTLKVTFETKENYSTESEVNGSHQTKHQGNIKNTQYGKEVKHSSGSPKQTRKKMATAGNESAVQETQKKVQFKDVDKDYQRKVYAQEVAKKIQTSIIAEMRNKLRSKATAIEKHQERIKAKESRAVDNITPEPKVPETTNESEVKGRPEMLKKSKAVTGVALDKNVHSSETEKTLQKVSSLGESLKKQEKEPSIISSNENKHLVIESQGNVKSRQNEGQVTNKETKSIPSDETKIKIPPKNGEVKLETDKKVSEFKEDSKLNKKDIQISKGVESKHDNDIQFISTSFSGPEHDTVSYKGRGDKSSATLVNKNHTDVCEDRDKNAEVKLSEKGFFNVSKYITNTKIQEFKKKLNTDVTHSKKDEKDKLSEKDIQISKGVEPRQINDIQFISTSFSGPDSPTSYSTGSKEDQKSPELTYKRFDFDESSESKSLSSDSTVKEEQVSDDEVEDTTNEDIMAELRKLLPLEIFSSRKRHVEESSIEDDTPCDCCECQGSSDEEYSVDGRIPQLSVIGEEDEEAVSVFDPDNEEMEFHRKFMEKVYGRNPRASKVFNPGVIVESGSDSSENGETEEQEIEEFEGKKKPVFDIEAFLKYTGNVEDWLERIEDLVPPRLPIEKPELYTISPESVTLTWKRARVPDKIRDTCNLTYTVEVRNPPNLDWRELVTSLTSTNTDIKGLHPRLDYLFRIRAWNEYGCSEPSLPVSLHRPIELSDDYDSGEDWDEQYRVTLGDLDTPIDEAPPKLPMETPRIRDSGETAMLSWFPARIPAYAKKTPITYIIEIKEPHVPGWSRLTSGISDTNYMIEGLRPTQDYQFRVKAETQYGVSDPTLPASLDRPKEIGKKSDFLADPGYYEIFKRDWDSHTDKNKRSSVDLLREDIDLPIKREPQSPGVPPRIPSSRPLISHQYPDRLTLSWMPARVPSYVKSQKLTYIVEVREPPSTLWRSLTDNLRDTEYDVTNLNPEQDYLFRVRAKNEYGLSEPTMPVSVIRERDEYVPHSYSRSGSFDSGSPWVRSRASSVESLRKQKSFDFTDDESDIFINREKKACPPEFKATNEDVHYGVEGSSCKVILGVKGYPLPSTSWFFMGTEVDYGNSFKANISPSGNATLEIIKLTKDLVGEYKCTAENEHGTATKVVRLQLADQPTVLDPISDLTLDSHKSGKLVCRVDGFPYPTVKFLKDSRPLAGSSRLRVDFEPPDTWTLTLDKAITTDSGVYTCVAENMAGKATCSAKVTIEENEDDLDRDLMAKPLPYREAFMEDYYYVLEEIGRGRHGIVRRVLDKFTGSQYAAKFIHVCDEHQRRFFRTELNVLRWLNQRGVPKVVDAFVTERRIVIITEIVTDYDIIDSLLQSPTPTESMVAAHIKQLLLVIKELHKAAVLHLDIKPSNIRFGTNNDLTLIDFGFSERIQRNKEVRKNYGTPGFCSPEQVHNEPVSEASDVWSIGATVYTLLTGLSPFGGSTEQEVLQSTIQYRWQEVDGLSPDAKDFLSKILIRNQKERMTVDGCLSHPWIKNSESQGGVINKEGLSEFQAQYKLKSRSAATRGPVLLQSLLSVLEGRQETGIRLGKDSATGELSFPESGLYGEYLDQESWFDWQSRYYYGLDADESETESVCEDPVLKKEREWLQMAEDQKQQLQRPQDFFPKEEEEEDNPQFTIKLHDTYYKPGDKIALSCHVTGSSNVSVSWFQNEELISDGKRMKTTLSEDGIASLVISSAKAYDDGIYKCTARNKTGKSSTYARVMVGETPSQPGRPVISQVSSCDVLLLWEPPENDGNSDIINYRVDYRQSGSDCWCLGTFSINECALVTGLTPDTSYRFRVCCLNKLGNSPYSVSSVLITTKPKGSADISLDPFTISQLSKQHEGLSFYQPPKNIVSPEDVRSREITLQTSNVEEFYSFSNILWRGKFSSYVRSTDKTNKNNYITKITPCSDSNKDSLTRELEFLRTINHERFVHLYGAYFYLDQYYWILEYLSGVNVVEHFSYKSKYTEDMVAIVIRQVLDGLQFLHYHGYAHLNIQPSSIMMVNRRRLDVRIVDFGLVQKVIKEGQIVPRDGNPEFMAPEVVVKETTSYPADIWSVGVLAFLLLSGESPFKGQDEETTFANIAYNRYNALSLYENITKEALKFIFRVLKRVARNRMTADECLEDKWLQTSETMLKFRTEAVFPTVKLRNYVTESFLESLKVSEVQLLRLREKFLITQEAKVEQTLPKAKSEGEKENPEEQADKPAVSKKEVKETDVTEETSNNIANEAIDEALSSENVS